jgi:predicted component of type VI protein secretion system
MKKYLMLLTVALSTMLFVGCQYDDDMVPPNYVSLEFKPGGANVGVEIDGTSTYEVKVYAANISNVDRQFSIVVDASSTLGAEAYSVPTTVTIPGGTNEASFTVQASDKNLGISGKKLVLNVQNEAGLSVGQNLQLNVFRTCVGKEFVVDFVFDGYASETSWTLSDSNGTVLVNVKAKTYKDGTASVSKSLCLDPGTYTFTVKDSFGDGLTYPNLGSVTLSYAGNELVVIPGDFDAETSVDVTF